MCINFNTSDFTFMYLVKFIVLKSLQNFLTAEVIAIARVTKARQIQPLKKYSNGVILQNSHVLILHYIADNKDKRYGISSIHFFALDIYCDPVI